MQQLLPKQIDDFINHGFVKIENAFSIELARECCDILWQETKCDRGNPASWIKPVIRIGELGHEAFKRAANTEILQNAFDQLVGKGNWLPKESLGSFPIRFPNKEPADDTGWHVDASFPGPEVSDYLNWRININSRGRGLLMLFLFSDVSERDAPTRIRVGSHLDVAKMLEPKREKGLSFMELAEKLDDLPVRKEELATGEPGTVFLCHPFIVHAAQDNCGAAPKFMAQPPLLTKYDFNIDRAGSDLCPVERAILKGISR
ncbi:MAG: phytanoyl-CoA dioxygenase family protein [Flavisolibacter sp.]